MSFKLELISDGNGLVVSDVGDCVTDAVSTVDTVLLALVADFVSEICFAVALGPVQGVSIVEVVPLPGVCVVPELPVAMVFLVLDVLWVLVLLFQVVLVPVCFLVYDVILVTGTEVIEVPVAPSSDVVPNPVFEGFSIEAAAIFSVSVVGVTGTAFVGELVPILDVRVSVFTLTSVRVDLQVDPHVAVLISVNVSTAVIVVNDSDGRKVNDVGVVELVILVLVLL